MIQDIAPKKFDNQYHPAVPRETDTVFFFRGHNRGDGTVLCHIDGDTITFPTVREVGSLPLRYLFSIDAEQFFLAPAGEETALPGGYAFENTRALRAGIPQHHCFAATTGFHLYMWYRESRFCGCCGHATVHDDKLRMMRCPACGNQIFPKIAPAVIIGLRNGNSLMMSRYAGRAYKGRALLAGFCEIGETPEETVVREVMEEVGLKATNVTYYASQPWGFDANLLLGYFCDLDGSDAITLDTSELATAGFVPREEIVYEPNMASLTATMIEAFRRGEA